MIKSEVWNNWSKISNEQTPFYAEYKNFGLGFKPDRKVKWPHQANEVELEEYTLGKILKGWDPIDK